MSVGLLSLIQDFISSEVQTELNSNLNSSVKLQRVTTEQDFESVGQSESELHYLLSITGNNELTYETRNFDSINIRLDFSFDVTNKDYTVYQEKFDRYIYAIRRILKDRTSAYSNNDISQSLKILQIQNIQITNTDNFTEDGFYYRPSIEFTLFIYDNRAITNQINVA